MLSDHRDLHILVVVQSRDGRAPRIIALEKVHAVVGESHNGLSPMLQCLIIVKRWHVAASAARAKPPVLSIALRVGHTMLNPLPPDSGHSDAILIRSTLQEMSPSIIITAVSYPSWDDGLNHNDVIDEIECPCQVTAVPYLQVDVADTTRWQQPAIPVYPIVGIGDISFISNDEGLADSFQGWTSNSYPSMAPRSFDDVPSGSIMEWLRVYAGDQATMALVATAFPGSIEEESSPLNEFDTVETDQDRARMDVSEDAIQQETELAGV